ncbi:Carbohydrate-binding X8 domain superfamily protein [Trifolium repens]|nr:Carbohydrate-binding X8 domain superfamily protein [Trifolium repens]
MATSRGRMNVGILIFWLLLATISLTHCDADRSIRLLKAPKHRKNVINKNPKKLKIMKHFDFYPSIYSSNAQPYSISSPLSLPPYESLAPEKNPPYCVYPPPSSSSPSINVPPTPTSSQPTLPSPPYYYTSPDLPTQSPPPTPTTVTPSPPETFPTPTPETIPSPPSTPTTITPSPPETFPTPTPETVPGPPSTTTPSPPESFPTPTPETVPSPPNNIPGSPEPIFNPPIIYPGPPESSTSPPYFEPAPPFIPSPTGGSGTIPSPPSTFPSPSGGTVPSPTVFQPPVVYPPPSVPPPPNTAPQATLWCVAKASVPDPIIEEAMNYACWSGADCTSIQPNGPCFQPDSVFAHASYAFNSYWQRTKASGGTCEFGGTAVLVSVDPSYDGCHFIYN